MRGWGGGGSIWKREVGTILLPLLPLNPSQCFTEQTQGRSRETTGIATCNEKRKTLPLQFCSLANQRERGPSPHLQAPCPAPPQPSSYPLLCWFGGDAKSSSLPPQPPAQSNHRQGQRGAGSGSGDPTLSPTPGPRQGVGELSGMNPNEISFRQRN